jgi:ClpP class serine protease
MMAIQVTLVRVASSRLIEGLEADYSLQATYAWKNGGTVYYLEPTLAAKEVGDALSNGGVVFLDGPILPESVRRIESLVVTKPIVFLYLNSPGGVVSDTVLLGRMLRAHNIITVVDSGHSCVSACALLFLSGVKRIASDKSAVIFHTLLLRYR